MRVLCLLLKTNPLIISFSHHTIIQLSTWVAIVALINIIYKAQALCGRGEPAPTRLIHHYQTFLNLQAQIPSCGGSILITQ